MFIVMASGLFKRVEYNQKKAKKVQVEMEFLWTITSNSFCQKIQIFGSVS
jgi:hypothetical protein